jgi:DNA repair protein RadC
MTNTDKPTHAGHRERIRRKFETGGLDSFLEHEILELLLTYSLPRKDTKPLAWALLKKFGSLSAVLDAPADKLEQVAGIGPRTAQLIVLVHALFVKYARENMKKPSSLNSLYEVLTYCKTSLRGKEEEFVELIFLSVRNTVIDTQIIASGLIDRVLISPRKIVECALQAKAASIILVHNHPSGDAQPSKEDIQLTQEIIRAAEFFNIKVYDHIIVGKNSFFSFHENRFVSI